jgi:hypothetical protein
MASMKHPVQIENYQLSRLIEQGEIQILQNHRIIRLLSRIAHEVETPFLAKIHILFQGDSMPGPVTLTSVGQQVTASVVGFDQFGQPFTGTIPTPTFSSDDTAQAIVTFDPATGLTTAVANGVANITATLTTAEGLALKDTEAITVAIPVVPPPTPVLSSIKVSFA